MQKKSLLCVCLFSALLLNACTAIPSSLIQNILSDLSPETKAEIQGALQNFLSLSADEQLEVAQVAQNPELVSYLKTQSTQSESVRRRNLQNYCQQQPELVGQIEKSRKQLQDYYQANDAEVISAMEAWADMDEEDWQAQWQQVQSQRELWESKLEMMRKPGRFQTRFDEQSYSERRAMADDFENCLYLPPQAQKNRVQLVNQRYGNQFNRYRHVNGSVPPTMVYQQTHITIIHSQSNCCPPIYGEQPPPNWDYPYYPRPYPSSWPSVRPTPRPWPMPTPQPTASHSSEPDSDNKITICHVPPGNPAAARTLRISASAWQKGHKPYHAEDYLGACESRPEPSSTPTPQPSSTPTPQPSSSPSPEPTVTPTPEPTPEPTSSPEAQITICHVPPGNLENPQTLTISRSAWIHGHQDQHEKDYLGACLDSE